MRVIPVVGDNNCGYNSFLLGLIDLAQAHKADDDKLRQERIIELFKEALPDKYSTIKDWEEFIRSCNDIIDTSYMDQLQQRCAPILRKIAAKELEKTFNDKLGDIQIEIELAFDYYLKSKTEQLKPDEKDTLAYFISHPVIKELFEEMPQNKIPAEHAEGESAKDTLQKILNTNPKDTWGKSFCEEIADNKLKIWLNQFELGLLAHYFFVAPVISKWRNYSLSNSPPEFTLQRKIFSKEKIVYLVSKKVIEKVDVKDSEVEKFQFISSSRGQVESRISAICSEKETQLDKGDKELILKNWDDNVRPLPAISFQYVSFNHYNYLTDNAWLVALYDKKTLTSTVKQLHRLLTVSEIRKEVLKTIPTQSIILQYPTLTSFWCCTRLKTEQKVVHVDIEKEIEEGYKELMNADNIFVDKINVYNACMNNTSIMTLFVVAIIAGVVGLLQGVGISNDDASLKVLAFSIVVINAIAAAVESLCKWLKKDAEDNLKLIALQRPHLFNVTSQIDKYIPKINTSKLLCDVLLQRSVDGFVDVLPSSDKNSPPDLEGKSHYKINIDIPDPTEPGYASTALKLSN